MKKVLVTGAAGFIGSTLVDALLKEEYETVGLDNFCSRYDPKIKRSYIADALCHENFKLYEADVRDWPTIRDIFVQEKPDACVHLAGHTGVYASLRESEEFFSTNTLGTQCILEACRAAGCKTLVFSSTGSVYGHSPYPASEDSPLPEPSNPYVASKRLAEQSSASYAAICGLNVTALRIFSVYGPRQRSNMAIHQFARGIDIGLPLTVYGNGQDSRNFLYVGNCVDGIIRAMTSADGFQLINLGEDRSVTLLEIIEKLSANLGKAPEIHYVPTPAEIMPEMSASIEKARRVLGYEPKTGLDEGLREFVQWYIDNKNLIHGEEKYHA